MNHALIKYGVSFSDWGFWMITIPGYEIHEKIYDGVDTELYRGIRTADNHAVVFKLLREEYPSLEKVSRFLHEHEVLKKLDGNGTVEVYDLHKYKNSFVIIMEEFGISLKNHLSRKIKLQLTESLAIAINIVKSLGKIHKQNFIHKDINPTNILIDPDSLKVKLIDFGISTALFKESIEVKNINTLEGTLPYVSPEQTGRMNRGIDYRSDYYSLGINLYELFTGRLPFESEDRLELVYSHIAKFPPSPHEVDPEIPVTISNIIMKLMAKTAEERYTSYFGILFDLQECESQLQKTATIIDFPLASNDLSTRFQIPEKLYGRENEVKLLMQAFDQVSTGQSMLMLVAGYPGIGKTTLVHELHKPIIEKRGFFVSGKFDQLKRNIPYEPFIQALGELIDQLLTEDETIIAQWRERLIKGLGSNAGVIVELLPSISKIIGEQPPVSSLGPTETLNRFNLVFQKLVEVFSTAEHPLTLFLDDLQWVDLPSLKLLQAILSQPNIHYLFIIGAYRDNEVSPSHPLMLSIDSFQREGILIEKLTVEPLQIHHIQALLADTLLQPKEVLKPLADVCHKKSLGNPFFLNQFLHTLYEEDLITFDTNHGTWHWLIEKIRIHPSTSNVVDLIINNIQKLSFSAQMLLKYASCLGNTFDLQTLSAILEKSSGETGQILEETLQQGYILPLDEAYRFTKQKIYTNPRYQFLHDRVQQASYLLLNDHEKKIIHLKIARYFMKIYSGEKLEENLFSVINQFNLGIDSTSSEEEKMLVMNLNLRAAKKAKASAAYAAGLGYANFGLQFLGKNSWVANYEFTLALYTEAAEAAYLTDDFNKSEEYANQVLKHAENVLDQARIYEIKIYTEIARDAPAMAVVIGLEVLQKLGINFPKNPGTKDVIWLLIKIRWQLIGKSEKTLINLSVIQDSYKMAACNILTAIIAPAYFATPLLFPLVTLELLNLSLRYGYNKGTPSSFASYGIILCGVLGNVPLGYAMGQLADRLVEHHDAVDQEAKIKLMVNGFIIHWKDPLRSTLAPLLAAHIRGVETGDLEYSTYSAYFYLVCSFYAGVELVKIADDMKRFYDFSKYHHTHKPVFYSMLVLGQVIDNLLELSANKDQLAGKYFNEEQMMQEAINTNNLFGLYSLHVVKLILGYLFGNYEQAGKAAMEAKKYTDAAVGSIPVKTFNFYDSLNHISLAETATDKEKKSHLKTIKSNQKQLKKWMNNSPANCSNKYYLIEAELARINKNPQAENYYDEAIKTAKQFEFVQEYALANELAAKYYLSMNKEMIAKGYMNAAYYSYMQWGAVAKIKQLEEIYPQLLAQPSQTSLPVSPIAKSIHGQMETGNLDLVDLETVVKASQSIAREIVLSELLDKLMHFVIENAGAQKGCLLLATDGKWNIEAEIENNQVSILQSLPFENNLPKSIIQYVINSSNLLLLDDASKNNQFISDPYIQEKKPKSILTLPLLNQGVLNGILYLENNSLSGAFTENRVTLLNLLSAQIVISIENARLYSNMADLNVAYERFIPREFLDTLEKKNIIEVRLSDQVQKDMTVMFCDIRNFTAISEKLTPQENFSFVNNFLGLLGPIIKQYGGFIDKYIGDSIMAIFPSHTEDALTCSIKMLEELREYNNTHVNLPAIEIGIGLNSGLLMLGIVGDEHHMEGTVISDVVNVASRTEELTKQYGAALLITENTYKRLLNPAKYAIRKLDTVLAKGKSIPITIYEVFENDEESTKFLKNQTRDNFEKGASCFYLESYEEAKIAFNKVLHLNPSDKGAQFYIERCNEKLKALK